MFAYRMAHTFDNRNFASSEQKPLFPSVPSSLKSLNTNTQWDLLTKPDNILSFDNNYLNFESSMNNDYLTLISDNCNSDTKPPSSARTQKFDSTTNNNSTSRSNLQTNTTYLNATQLYIKQPSNSFVSSENSSRAQQKNSVTIPNFNSSTSTKSIYQSTTNENNVHRFNSLSIDNNHSTQEIVNGSTVREYFGECPKCGETITNFDDPCDILGQIYHSSCATCVLCGRSVKNKHFFIKDQLYCQEDFLYTGFQQTLEYCVACKHSIPDTILQALGKSYHVTCFKCSKCSICLDGLPFTIDKDRNLFCLRDYHLTYGPRCDKCLNPIFPEDGSNETVRILSMGKTFHVQCYQCEDCFMQLGNEQNRRCHPLDDKLFCQKCFEQRHVTVDRF